LILYKLDGSVTGRVRTFCHRRAFPRYGASSTRTPRVRGGGAPLVRRGAQHRPGTLLQAGTAIRAPTTVDPVAAQAGASVRTAVAIPL
jgi:hypothetical protein